MNRQGIVASGVRVLALLAGLAAPSAVLPQNLNQKFGSDWSCERLLPSAFFCNASARVDRRVGAYGDECVIYDACMKCERTGQDFVKTSGTGGHCAARGSASMEAPRKPSMPDQSPRAGPAGSAKRQLELELANNDEMLHMCLRQVSGNVGACGGRCYGDRNESSCNEACERTFHRENRRCDEESAAREARIRARYPEAREQSGKNSVAASPTTPFRPAVSGSSVATGSTRNDDGAPAGQPGSGAKQAIVETARKAPSDEACRVDPLTAKVEASLTRGALPGVSELNSLASDMARRRERGCAMGHAKATANPFAAQAGAAIRQFPSRRDEWQPLRVDLEPEPAAYAGETRSDPDCLGLSRSFTLSGIGRCLRYMVKNHPAQGQALTLDAIDRALLNELGKEGLYGTP